MGCIRRMWTETAINRELIKTVKKYLVSCSVNFLFWVTLGYRIKDVSRYG